MRIVQISCDVCGTQVKDKSELRSYEVTDTTSQGKVGVIDVCRVCRPSSNANIISAIVSGLKASSGIRQSLTHVGGGAA